MILSCCNRTNCVKINNKESEKESYRCILQMDSKNLTGSTEAENLLGATKVAKKGTCSRTVEKVRNLVSENCQLFTSYTGWLLKNAHTELTFKGVRGGAGRPHDQTTSGGGSTSDTCHLRGWGTCQSNVGTKHLKWHGF